jgi:hypothetical protein
VAAVAVPLFGVVAAFGTVEHVPEPVPVGIVIQPLAYLRSGWRLGNDHLLRDRFRRNDTLATRSSDRSR